MSLIQPLPAGALDIVGDIHGEYEALCNLIRHLNYDQNGMHPENRMLVFVGDFCDRGPDSPAVLSLIERLVRAGRAVAVLGNHEINLLIGDPKDGSGWFFDDRAERDQDRYTPFNRSNEADREKIIAFLSLLPIALERQDLRIIHAAWVYEHIEEARALSVGSIRNYYEGKDGEVRRQVDDLAPLMLAEREKCPQGLDDPKVEPPFLNAHADYETFKQMGNPLKVLTSGIERKGTIPFYSSGKWRFVERVQWWKEYDDCTPVVVGHYWRRFNPNDRKSVGKGDPDLFVDVAPDTWHGKRSNVFCVDFSVGGRWAVRKGSPFPESNFRLAALQWPERTLLFDDGQRVMTKGFAA